MNLPTRVRELRQAGQLVEALDLAKKLAEADTGNRRHWGRLAHLAYLAGEGAVADAAVARLAELSLASHRPRDAVRLLLRRTGWLAANGGNPVPVVEQALAVATQTGDTVGVFLARQTLAALAVRRGDAEAAREALNAYLRAGVGLGREGPALQAVSQLAVEAGPGAGVAARMLGLRAVARGEREVATQWLLEALRRLPEDDGLEAELEKLAFSIGLWKELATLYQLRAERSRGSKKVQALEQFAELCEDELADPRSALQAYEAAYAVDGSRGPLREIFRLSALFGALEAGVQAWKQGCGGKLADGVELLEQLAQSDLPPLVRAKFLETLAAVAANELGDPARAEALLVKSKGLLRRASSSPDLEIRRPDGG